MASPFRFLSEEIGGRGQITTKSFMGGRKRVVCKFPRRRFRGGRALDPGQRGGGKIRSSGMEGGSADSEKRRKKNCVMLLSVGGVAQGRPS